MFVVCCLLLLLLLFLRDALTDASRNAKYNKIIRRTRKQKKGKKSSRKQRSAANVSQHKCRERVNKKRSIGKSIQLKDNLIKHNYLHLFLLLIKWLIIDDNSMLYNVQK